MARLAMTKKMVDVFFLWYASHHHTGHHRLQPDFDPQIFSASPSHLPGELKRHILSVSESVIREGHKKKLPGPKVVEARQRSAGGNQWGDFGGNGADKNDGWLMITLW